MTTANENLFAALRAGFPADLDATAIETCDTPEPLYYTWRDLERASARVANLLASLEIPADSRVAVHTDKSVEALILYLGVLRAGYVYLPLNTAYQAAELEYFIGNAEPAVVVCAPRNFPWVSKLAFKAGVRNVFTLGTAREGTLLERAAQMGDAHAPAVRRADDLAAILYTSGTTGRSKGAMLSHGNLLSNARVLKDFWGWKDGDVLIHALPIFHVHGLFVASHGALLNGSKMLWFEKFDPRATIRAMARASVFMGVPTLYVRMLAEPSLTREAAARMRIFLAGSAPLLPETFNAWQERTGQAIVERYGMSETIMLTSNAYHARDGVRRAGTVGKPLPGVQLRIHDEQGRECAAGEIGGIQVKGPNVFSGYWRMPEKTAEEFTADGWFRTGDVGKREADGVVTIVGRSKDLIISGGYNVYPAEIEGYLNEQPGVAESAVVGVPHPDFGEGVIAVVVPKPGAVVDGAALVAAMKARIAAFKVPKRVFVEAELPRNQMGKVQKNLLREQHKALFSGG
ncbi:MAG TPA: malonyl-CoA synthase [Burkholderiaceae bacterium]|nr:malonyl-CoA synthase [Burkholderiaceae bacterium]